MTKPTRRAYGKGRNKQYIVRVSPAEWDELQVGAGLMGTNVPDVLRRGGLGLAWRLRKVRELMDGGLTADQAANFLIAAGTGGTDDDGADRL